MKNQNEQGQIKAPPKSANAKHRLGPNREPHSTHPGRAGLYGQPKDSGGYSPKGQQKKSGPV
jgi:hypothetical protein